MAEEKKGFILYADQIALFKQLPNDKAGELIKHIFEYVNDNNPETDDLLINLAFTPIKQQFKRDLEKWESKKGIKSRSGQIGNLKRYSPEIYKEFLDKKHTLEESLELAKGRKGSQEVAKLAVNDTVKVNVNDTVKVNVKVNVKDKVILKVYSKEVNDCFESCLKFFPESTRPKTDNSKNDWLDTIDKLNRIEKIEFNLIVRIVKKVRNDEFWSKNFLSLTKLRQKNKEQIMYIVVFYEKFRTNGKPDSKNGTGSTVSQEYLDKIARTLQSD